MELTLFNMWQEGGGVASSAGSVHLGIPTGVEEMREEEVIQGVYSGVGISRQFARRGSGGRRSGGW